MLGIHQCTLKSSYLNICTGCLMQHFFKTFFGVCLFMYVCMYVWLCWVFVSVQGLSLVAASGGHSSQRCAGLSLSRPLLLRSTSFRRAGSVAVAHGPSCFAACGIFPDQGSNPCPLHWQADSQPLRHQGSPNAAFLIAHPGNDLNVHQQRLIRSVWYLSVQQKITLH